MVAFETWYLFIVRIFLLFLTCYSFKTCFSLLNTNQNPSHQCKIIILLEGKIYYLTKKGNKIHVTIKINSASGYNCILPLNLEIKLGTLVSWTDERLHALLIDVCFEKKRLITNQIVNVSIPACQNSQE